MDQIIIQDLEVYAYHGVYDAENEKGQHFYVNAILESDLAPAGTQDELELSTNYGEVCLFLRETIQKDTYKLIETVATKCANAVLYQFPLVRTATIEIRKPEAPIPMKFKSVSVKITRGWHRAYIAFGSNMGDRKQYVENAIEQMNLDVNCRLIKQSSFYESTPYGGIEQDNFINGVFAIDTLYNPRELLNFLHEVEAQADRKREVHWGPRTLDLDILLYDDLIVSEEDLMIPHVDMLNRDFVMEPLKEIAPYVVHPLENKRIMELADLVKEKHI